MASIEQFIAGHHIQLELLHVSIVYLLRESSREERNEILDVKAQETLEVWLDEVHFIFLLREL